MSNTVPVSISKMAEAEALAAELGLSLSELIDVLIDQALEDAEDYRSCVEAMNEFKQDSRTYSLDEVMKENGLI